MAKKTSTGFNVDNAIGRIMRPSVFDRLVKEIDAHEIPAKYVEHLLVQYHDGNVIEIGNEEITKPIPLNKNITWTQMDESFKKIRDVRVFINTDILEKDINELVEDLLGPYC